MIVHPRRRRRRRQKAPTKIVVEVVTPEIVGRLEADNAAMRTDLKQLRAEKDSLHAALYRLMDVVSDLRKRQGKS